MKMYRRTASGHSLGPVIVRVYGSGAASALVDNGGDRWTTVDNGVVFLFFSVCFFMLRVCFMFYPLLFPFSGVSFSVSFVRYDIRS